MWRWIYFISFGFTGHNKHLFGEQLQSERFTSLILEALSDRFFISEDTGR